MKNFHRLILVLLFSAATSLAYGDRQATDDERNIDDPRVQHRTYTFPPTGETIPYALFVPESYDANAPADSTLVRGVYLSSLKSSARTSSSLPRATRS